MCRKRSIFFLRYLVLSALGFQQQIKVTTFFFSCRKSGGSKCHQGCGREFFCDHNIFSTNITRDHDLSVAKLLHVRENPIQLMVLILDGNIELVADEKSEL